MTGELLNIAQAAAALDAPLGRLGDESTAPAMARCALEAQLATEALTGFYAGLPTTEMLAAPHGGGHHALRILAAAASNSWIESTNSTNTSRGDAKMGSRCCSICSSSPITREGGRPAALRGLGHARASGEAMGGGP
jgi:hypothetical protein